MTEHQPASQNGLRRGNLALVLRALRAHGPLSRAQLAARCGLAKATVSSLVTDLGLRGLVHETGAAVPGQGRPGQQVALRPDGAHGLGLDVHADHVGVAVIDLTGAVVHQARVALDVPAAGPARAMDALAELARQVGQEPVGVTVSVPGLVDTDAGAVTIAPRLRWQGVAVADELAARTGFALDLIAVGNDANLGAQAESEAMPNVHDLAYVNGDFGVGGALVADGRLIRGSLGYAGEIGHMPMDPFGATCSCGRRGCWESQVGLAALLHACADPTDPVHDPSLDLASRMRLIRERAEQGDRRTLDALHATGSSLAIGVSIVVNLVNPAVVVLGGYFAALPEWLIEPVRDQVVATTLAPGGGGVRIVGSRLDFAEAAALAGLRRVFADPAIVPMREEAPA
ncbi:ROK family transcriptional regulator [Labedaea rhizosphaerae]|uniref:ROK family transcriptional regulator n=1 Tax=Labedaea rhizosphaerae TaxID=598644 RepID=UPI00105F34B7|nr:ROK family transcriptional regulator [Labedaea rhizosphaerae]